jgi:hypothetical protein
MTAEIRDTAATEEKIMGTAKGFRQENLENTTHHQRICSMDHVIYTPRSSMENESPDTQ